MNKTRYEELLDQRSRVIAARLIAEMVGQPDGDAMIARAVDVFHREICRGVLLLIDTLEEEFEFSMDGLEMMADDSRKEAAVTVATT